MRSPEAHALARLATAASEAWALPGGAELVERHVGELEAHVQAHRNKRPRAEECLYRCEDANSALFTCNQCDRWFHSACAGYEEPLVEDPVYRGHAITLFAYCGHCLEDLGLTHAVIGEQQREYARLERFFAANADRWTWEPVAQDGRCCLNAIYSRHQGQFATLEHFIVACAKAAQVEVDASMEQAAAKRTIKGVLKKLVKDPSQLQHVWPQLEVQYLWLGLAKHVLRDVQLRLFELERGEQLRCIQQWPEEGRPHTICLLQWNRPVAAHYDVLVEERLLWPPGTLLDAEMSDPDFPDYADTIHPVHVVEALEEGGYRCALVAFADTTDVWPAALLHAPRDWEEREWRVGDRVHVRMRKRKVHKRIVDGKAASVWVKAVVIVERAQDHVMVHHTDWTNEGMATARIHVGDVRAAY